VRQELPASGAAARAWGFGLAPKIILGIGAGFMFGFAVLLFSIPLIAAPVDATSLWIVDGTGAVLLGFACFFVFGLIALARSRISISGTTLHATIPDHHNWLLVPRFRSVGVELGQIRSVDRREEAVRAFGFTTMRRSLSIVTTSGDRIGLFTNTENAVGQMPIDEIAAVIAAGAGIAVTDDGLVLSRAAGLYGAASSAWTETPLDAAGAAKVRRAAARTVQVVTALLLLTLVVRACT
jgi:hypothetical protein